MIQTTNQIIIYIAFSCVCNVYTSVPLATISNIAEIMYIHYPLVN